MKELGVFLLLMHRVCKASVVQELAVEAHRSNDRV